MDSYKPLGRVVYLTAFLLFVIPLFDAATSILPMHLGDERWRFGAVGTLANITLVPILGLLLAIAFATFVDQRRIRRLIGWISAIIAVVIAVLAVLFILDYFQVRTTVVPRFQHATAVATTTALVKHVFTIIVLVLMSRAGFAGPKALVVRKKQPVVAEPRSTPLIPMGNAPRAE